jgi:hypothetical protein
MSSANNTLVRITDSLLRRAEVVDSSIMEVSGRTLQNEDFMSLRVNTHILKEQLLSVI